MSFMSTLFIVKCVAWKVTVSRSYGRETAGKFLALLKIVFFPIALPCNDLTSLEALSHI